MIFFSLCIILIAFILLTIWIICKLKNLINKVNKLNLDLYIFQQKIALNLEKIKHKVTPAKKRKLSLFDITALITDIVLSLIYKKKYEKLKDVYEFLKATMA